MINILEGIFQGLNQWIYSLLLEIVEYIANGLLDVFSMDLDYFESVIPVTGDILNIIIASGWAFLLGNLIFQTAKSMMSGLGFEAEDPKTLFARTFVFGFFLLASRQICDIGLGISSTLIAMLQVPDSITITVPEETAFSIGASWLLVVIIGFVVMWQIVKLFFEIGERYFLLGFLTLMAPWAFAMGGSKSTADVFKGWLRMFASMCVMMVMNVIFLKMLLSAMGYLPTGVGALPWMILVVAIARVARKIDSIIARIGLNPAITGEGLGRGLPGMLSFMVIKSMASNIGKAAGGAMGASRTPPHGAQNHFSNSSAGNRSNISNRVNSGNNGVAQNRSSSYNNTSQQTVTGAAGTAQQGANTPVQTAAPVHGTAGIPPAITNNAPINAPSGAAGTAPVTTNTSVSNTNSGAAGTVSNSAINQSSGHQRNISKAGHNGAVTGRNDSHRSSVTSRSSALQNGAAGTSIPTQPGKSAAPSHPPIPRSGQSGQTPPIGTPSAPQEKQAPRPSRYTTVPPVAKPVSPAVGTSNVVNRASQDDTAVSTQNQTNMNANQSIKSSSYNASNRGISPSQKTCAPSGVRTTIAPAPSGSAGTGNRKTVVPTDKPQGTAGTAAGTSNATNRAGRETGQTPLKHSTSVGAAGTDTRRSQVTQNKPQTASAGKSPSASAISSATTPNKKETPRSGSNQPPPTKTAQTTGKAPTSARQEGQRNTEITTHQPVSGKNPVVNADKATARTGQKITQHPTKNQDVSKASKPVTTTRISGKDSSNKKNSRPVRGDIAGGGTPKGGNRS